MNIETVIKQLQQQGFRITTSRRDILSLFAGDHISLSAGEIVEQLRSKTDRATVYRNLNFLVENNILQQVFINGEVPKFELNNQDHHHHLICTNCKAISSISDPALEKALSDSELSAKEESGFRVKDHAIEFYGTCKNCS